MSGKNALGLRGFPTPNNVAPDGGYVVFRLPENNEWAGLILGAAQALSYAYNFYEWGDMTPDEAAEAFRQIVDVAPFNTCGCVLPTGGKIIRINVNGHFEELGDDGSWQEPSGDYEIPPVPTRGGGDPLCLAAANAENVLSQLYEEVVDMIAEGLSLIEIIGAVILFIATVIAGAIGLAAAALIEIIAIAFREFVAAAAFLGADVWDEDFSNALRCMLYECASDDAGVVTFDWDCLIEKLYQNTNPFDLTGAQIRLLGQVGFLLNIISIDGLNLAGATTAITEADCDNCARLWCRISDWTVETDGYVSGYPGYCPPYCSTWVSGQGWTQSGVSNPDSNGFAKSFDPISVNSFRLDWHGSGTGCGGCNASFQLLLSGSVVYTKNIPASETFNTGFTFDNDVGGILCDQIVIGGDAGGGGAFAFNRLEVVYNAALPELGEDNCP